MFAWRKTLSIVGFLAVISTASARDEIYAKRTIEAPAEQPSAAIDLRYAPIQQDFGQSFAVSIEWLPITRFGKFGIGGETGIFAVGNTNDPKNPNKGDYEIPLNLRLSYRFDYLPGQFFVPYVASTHNITSLRSATSRTSVQGVRYPLQSTTAQTIGIQLRLNNIDPALSLKRSLGVKNVYLSTEMELTDTIFLVGLKFEI